MYFSSRLLLVAGFVVNPNAAAVGIAIANFIGTLSAQTLHYCSTHAGAQSDRQLIMPTSMSLGPSQKGHEASASTTHTISLKFLITIFSAIYLSILLQIAGTCSSRCCASVETKKIGKKGDGGTRTRSLRVISNN